MNKKKNRKWAAELFEIGFSFWLLIVVIFSGPIGTWYIWNSNFVSVGYETNPFDQGGIMFWICAVVFGASAGISVIVSGFAIVVRERIWVAPILAIGLIEGAFFASVVVGFGTP